MATAYHNLSDYDFNSVPNAENMRFGIVVSEWNSNITDPLSVSYTHLNPDKTIAAEGRKALDIIHGFNITFKAVSYTHLDVYKRQP